MLNQFETQTQAAELLALRRRVAALELAASQSQQVEVALRQQVAKLQAQNDEALDNFAQTVAHDLKQPLSAVIGFSQMLANHFEALGEEQRRHCLGHITRNGYKMTSMLDELLLLAGAAGTEVTLAPLEMASIVQAAEQRLAYLIEESHTEIIRPADWPVALGYGPWVEEIWANYLSNAIKYGGQPPQVEIGARPLVNNRVCFWVRDNGRGLDRAEQRRLFRRFERLNQVRVEGHGLGLWIVREIAGKLGGQVSVESSGIPGQGSTFSFTLPVAAQPH